MFVVCGEALMDVFPQADTRTGMALDARVGGSPFNVAIGLARLGQASAFFGGLSQDFLGERLMRTLRDEGVDVSLVTRLAAPTTLSLVGVDAKGQPSYVFHGEGAADRMLPRVVLQQPLPASCVGLHVGSYTMVVEPVASTLRKLIEREAGERFISYDPNVRTTVEPDLQRWRDTLDWMAQHADLLKISEEDLSLLYPGSQPGEHIARWLAQGVSLVVLTRGGDGAMGCTTAQRVEVPVVPCQLIDTVGAGDTFQAALLTWLAEHDALTGSALKRLDAAALKDALSFAARAAAITCSRSGADLPRRAELGAA